MVRQLLILNGLAVICAVYHHTVRWGVTAMFWWTDRYRQVQVPNFDEASSPFYSIVMGLDHIAVVAVPVFLFTSGFFVAFALGGAVNQSRWRIVFRRIGTLVPPYVLWSAVVVGLVFLQTREYSVVKFGGDLLLGSATPPYYYIPLLIKCYLLSLLLVPLARRWPLLVVGIVLFLNVLVGVCREWFLLDPKGHSLGLAGSFLRNSDLLDLVGWFILGILAYLHLKAVKAFLIRARFLLNLAAGALFVAVLAEWSLLVRVSGRTTLGPQATVLWRAFALALLACLLANLVVWRPDSSLLAEIGTAALGIYLSHLPVLEVCARSCYHFAPGFLAWYPVFFVVLVLAGLAVPILAMKLLRWSPFSRAYSWVFGS